MLYTIIYQKSGCNGGGGIEFLVINHFELRRLLFMYRILITYWKETDLEVKTLQTNRVKVQVSGLPCLYITLTVVHVSVQQPLLITVWVYGHSCSELGISLASNVRHSLLVAAQDQVCGNPRLTCGRALVWSIPASDSIWTKYDNDRCGALPVRCCAMTSVRISLCGFFFKCAGESALVRY
jgi:hypothetical protein